MLFLVFFCFCFFQFSFLTFQGILLFSPQSSLLQKFSRDVKIFVHWLFSVISAICMIIGGWVIYSNKEMNGKPHLQSWHGCLGFITIMYFIIQLFGGLMNKYSSRFSNYVDIKQLRLGHALSGTLLFALLTTTVMLGVYSNWFVSVVTGTSWYACVLCPIIIAMVVFNQTISKYVLNSNCSK